MKNRTCGECKYYDKTITCNDYAKCSCKEQLVYGVVSPKQQNCKHFEPKHKPTNGDRIRAMSDEKLVKVIWKGLCGLCPYKGSGNICNNDTDKECHEIILEELKKEVNNG